MKKFLLFLLFTIIIIGIGMYFYLPDYLSSSSNDTDIEVKVEPGASLSSVADDLFEKEIIRSKLWFRYQGQDIAKKIKPGTYTFTPDLKLVNMYEILQQGEQEQAIVITIPEGFILYQIASRVAEAGFGTVEDFVEETNAYFIKNEYTFDTANLYFNMEGYLFPDTYHFTKKQTVTEIVSLLANTMSSILTDEYKNRAGELGLTTHEVITLASLIEREAYNDEERAKISGVIHNRIEKNMLLQIDATVIYGLGEGKEHMSRVLYADLERDNSFNTYKNTGLPPGPIASPGKNSIHAALYPEEHDYLYYVMGENGHIFANTYKEHLSNIAKYRK